MATISVDSRSADIGVRWYPAQSRVALEIHNGLVLMTLDEAEKMAADLVATVSRAKSGPTS